MKNLVEYRPVEEQKTFEEVVFDLKKNSGVYDRAYELSPEMTERKVTKHVCRYNADAEIDYDEVLYELNRDLIDVINQFMFMGSSVTNVVKFVEGLCGGCVYRGAPMLYICRGYMMSMMDVINASLKWGSK